MKKLLPLVLVLLTLASTAQIVNNDFENWSIDTTYFEGNATIPADTFTSENPVGWTSSNAISGADSLGGVFFVSKSTDSHSGLYSIKMITDTVKLPVIPGFPSVNAVIPGFALNGKFPLTPASLLVSGATVTPMSIAGAGQPFNQRLEKIQGYYNYNPVFNANTNSNDTCLVWATLRKGSIEVANAIFKSTASTTNFTYFEADFKYVSCETPDTLVVFIASSVPNVAAILGGNSGLAGGSEFWVDSLFYTVAGPSFNLPPTAVNDTASTIENTAKNIAVKTNDEDCDDALANLTITITQQPANGTAVVGANNAFITYTPNNGFTGNDTLSYTVSDGVNTSNVARVAIVVSPFISVGKIEVIRMVVYPVPAQDVMNVLVEGNDMNRIFVTDLNGRILTSEKVISGNNTISTSEFANGVYLLHVTDANNHIIGRSKFTVAH